MTLQIKLSELNIAPAAFAEQVAQHAAAMREYDAHLEGVVADAANPDLLPGERRVAFPPPAAHPLVERAVAEGYEFVGPSLAEKKAALFAEVKRMEAEGMQAAMPPAKARHYMFRQSDILNADQVRYAAAIAMPGPPIDYARFCLENRSAADTRFLEEQEARQDRQHEVQRWAAKQEHDIDDLTDETVDAFVLEPFVG